MHNHLGFYRPIILTFLWPLECEGPSDQNLEWNFFGFWAFSPKIIGFMVCFKASVSSIFYGLSNGVYIVTIKFIIREWLGVDPADPRKKYFFDPNFLTDLDRALFADSESVIIFIWLILKFRDIWVWKKVFCIFCVFSIKNLSMKYLVNIHVLYIKMKLCLRRICSCYQKYVYLVSKPRYLSLKFYLLVKIFFVFLVVFGLFWLINEVYNMH